MSTSTLIFTKENPILEKKVLKEMQRGAVVVEKQRSVRHLIEYFETKLGSNGDILKTNSNLKEFTNEFPSRQTTVKALKAKFEVNTPKDLHVSNLTVVLKSGSEANKTLQRNITQLRKKEDVNAIEPDSRTHQSKAYFTSPKKERQSQNTRLISKMIFQNEFLEQLFYRWLLEKHYVAFDVVPFKNSNDLIEIVPKNSCANALATYEVEKVLQKLINNLEARKQVKLAKGEESFLKTSDLALTSLTKTPSADSLTENETQEATKVSLIKPNTLCYKNSEEANSNSEKCFTSLQQLIFKHPFEPLHNCNTDQTTLELNKSFLKLANSPTKIKSTYTLTVISSPSSASESDYFDTDLPETPIKTTYGSWSSVLKADINPFKPVSAEFIHLLESKEQQEPQQVLSDSFIDQGFETEPSDMDSPLKLCQETERKSPSSFQKLRFISFKGLLGSCPSLDTATARKESFSSLNKSDSFIKKISVCPNLTNAPESSQFWITSGDFTASITIHHYEPEFLKLLSQIYAQKALETMEMNFGIDEQRFCLESTATPDEMLKNVPKELNYSQYWFSAGDVFVPFRGKFMTIKQINSFFNYIRECMEVTGALRFGVDNYEFSHLCKQTRNSISFNNDGAALKESISPLETSDLDQSDMELEADVSHYL